MSTEYKFSGRQPTYKLKIKDERTDKWLEVGAGWKNVDGSISVRLNACVVLDARFGVEPVLFPLDPEDKPRKRGGKDKESFLQRKLESMGVSVRKEEPVSSEKSE